jgi:hypothetical protein
MKSLSWYAQNKDSKDAYKYASDYFKKKYKLKVDDVVKENLQHLVIFAEF